MPRQEIDLNPVAWLTIDAVGQPGSRTFFLQGTQLPTGSEGTENTITLLLEKIQVQTLCVGAEQFLQEIQQKFPELPPYSNDFEEEKMHLQPPLDPLFQAGEIGLSYDSIEDKAILIVREVLLNQQTEEELREVRFWISRSQLAAVGKWGVELANRGRPICPQCGEPMDPAGHLCPKKNGHKK